MHICIFLHFKVFSTEQSTYHTNFIYDWFHHCSFCVGDYVGYAALCMVLQYKNSVYTLMRLHYCTLHYMQCILYTYTGVTLLLLQCLHAHLSYKTVIVVYYTLIPAWYHLSCAPEIYGLPDST